MVISNRYCRTPPGVRELKQAMMPILWLLVSSRTPPGVRELKHRKRSYTLRSEERRTPPGVRELKLSSSGL